MGGKKNKSIEEELEDEDPDRVKEIDNYIKNQSHTDTPLKDQVIIVAIFMMAIYLIIHYVENRAANYHYDAALEHGSGIAVTVQSAPNDGTEKVKW